MDWNSLYPFAMIFATVVGSIWGLAMWLTGQFSRIKDLIFTRTEKLEKSINDKLEYHERHDDRRFGIIQDDLLAIKLRNAAIDGPNTLKVRKQLTNASEKENNNNE